MLFCLEILQGIFLELLLGRFVRWVGKRKVLKEFQTLFHEFYYTVDDIFVLSHFMKLKLTVKQGKCGFDRIFQSCITVKIEFAKDITKVIKFPCSINNMGLPYC